MQSGATNTSTAVHAFASVNTFTAQAVISVAATIPIITATIANAPGAASRREARTIANAVRPALTWMRRNGENSVIGVVTIIHFIGRPYGTSTDAIRQTAITPSGTTINS